MQVAELIFKEQNLSPLKRRRYDSSQAGELPRPFILVRAAKAPYCFIMVRIAGIA